MSIIHYRTKHVCKSCIKHVLNRMNRCAKGHLNRILTAILEHLDIHIPAYENSIIDNILQPGCTLGKKQVGVSPNSLIHIVFLSYGHQRAAQLIEALQRVATHYLDVTGFSVGISDCIVNHKETIRVDRLNQYLSTVATWSKEDEASLYSALGEMTSLQLPENDDNRLLDMIESGSKGNMVNFNQITRCVGQQTTENGRVSDAFRNRTLPHFTQYDMTILKLNDLASDFISHDTLAVPHIVYDQRFERFDQPTILCTRNRCFTRRIDNPQSPCLCVKKEIRR